MRSPNVGERGLDLDTPNAATNASERAPAGAITTKACTPRRGAAPGQGLGRSPRAASEVAARLVERAETMSTASYTTTQVITACAVIAMAALYLQRRRLPTRRAAIEIGSNATRMLVADVSDPRGSVAFETSPSCGGATAATWIVRGRVAAAPRVPRGSSADGSRRHRGCHVDRPRTGRGDAAAAAAAPRASIDRARNPPKL